MGPEILAAVRLGWRSEIGSKKISPSEVPHTERTGDLREYDRLRHHCQEAVMGSGAYAVFIDQQAPGGGPPGSLRRVVPLPPPELSGGVKFTTVVLSLAYDNFGMRMPRQHRSN